VDTLRPTPFEEALRHLHGLLGQRIKVTVNDYGRFFGCGFEGALERVETLPPDDKVVRVVLGGGGGLFLDPTDVEVFMGREDPLAIPSLEFQVFSGSTVTIEMA
jgi:hypothetical protein